jgi:PAS domain S-box-containing protein
MALQCCKALFRNNVAFSKRFGLGNEFESTKLFLNKPQAEQFAGESRSIMEPGTLSQRIEAVERRLEALIAAQQGTTAETSDLLAVLEELRGAAEELRRQSEEAHQAQALLYSLVEVMPIGVVICGVDGTVLMTNANGEDILGAEIPGTTRYPERTYTPHRLNGSSFLAEEMPLRRALEDGEIIRDVEMVIRHPAGEERIILASAAPIRDETGHIVSGVTVFQDITARKRAEEVIESLARFPRENPNPVLRISADGAILYANAGSAPVLAVWGGHSGEKAPGEWQEIVAQALACGSNRVVEISCDERVFSITVVPVAAAGCVNLYGLDITERERAREVLQRYADRLRVLHESDQAILAARSTEEIAASSLRHLLQFLDCVQASVLAFDLEANEVTFLAAHSKGETRMDRGWRGPIEAGWLWMVEKLAQGQPYMVEDLQDAPASSPLVETLQTEGVQARVYVPLVAQGMLIGSLNLGMADPGPLTPEEIEMTRELADQLAVAIQQSRLHERVQQHADELEQEVLKRTAALRASEERFRAIFEDAAIGIALADAGGRVLEANPALRQMLRCDAEALRDRVITTMLSHPGEDVNEADLFAGLVAGERNAYRLQGRCVRQSGDPAWANLTVSGVRGDTGELKYAIAMVEDITERRQAQEALIQSEKLAVTGRLAASLAHEINNPLQSVIGCLGLAQESLAAGEEKDADELLRIATEELERAAGIVAQLRDMNRPAGSGERECADVNLLLEHVLMLTREQCHRRGVEVERDVTEELPSLMLAPDRIQQAFLNLVLNAIEAMPDGGQLRVSTSRTSDPPGVSLSFTDTGPGIAPDALPHVFDPFYTTKSEGLGLGLYITRNIVEEHGGRIEVESLLGEGATFTVWLPTGEEMREGED